MKSTETMVSVDTAIDVITKMETMLADAVAEGKTEISLSPLQAAFAALDAAEAELDKAIEEAK